MNLKKYIREIPNHPKEGILFYDISTLLMNSDAFAVTCSRMANAISKLNPDILLGIESRGFLIVAPIALKLGCPFAMIRKPNKLPGEVISYEYDLEYGSDKIEIQKDAVKKGQRIVIIDDLLATGGTMEAAIKLVENIGGEVISTAFLIELEFLKGRDKFNCPVYSLLSYDK